MSRLAFLFATSLLLAPMAAHADCTTDLAATENTAHVHNFDLEKNQRVKALWDKAKNAERSHNDRDCRDALTGLNRMTAEAP